MSWRGPAAVAAMLALGMGGGFGASLAAGRQPVTNGVPTPVAAQSPSIPVDPEPVYVADPTVAPLSTDLALTTGQIGPEDFRYEFPVPAGWVATPNNATTTKWHHPDNPPFTYFLRVEQLDGDNKTVARTLEERIVELHLAEDDLEVVEQTTDSLTFSYTADQRRRFGMLRWLRPSGSPFAEVEVALTGREVDLPGMAALVEEISTGMRRA